MLATVRRTQHITTIQMYHVHSLRWFHGKQQHILKSEQPYNLKTMSLKDNFIRL